MRQVHFISRCCAECWRSWDTCLRRGWDFAGSGLAGRNEQYERFYLASAPRNYAMAQMFADRQRANRLVARFLDEPLA